MGELTRNHPRIASGKTGTDNAFVTGTAPVGLSTEEGKITHELAEWDANGNLVSRGVRISVNQELDAGDPDGHPDVIPTERIVKNYVDIFRTPAISQKILTRANRWYNGSSTNSTQQRNTSPPINPTSNAEGEYRSENTWWLVEEATDTTSTGTRAAVGEKFLIDDLQLKSTNSYVKLSTTIHTDTNSSNVAPGFLLQKSTDGGLNWSAVTIAAAYGSTVNHRIEATFVGVHGRGDRGMCSNSYSFIDMNPGTTTPQYRILISLHPEYYVYLNRDYNLDSGGSGIGSNDTDRNSLFRATSIFTAEEIIR